MVFYNKNHNLLKYKFLNNFDYQTFIHIIHQYKLNIYILIILLFIYYNFNFNINKIFYFIFYKLKKIDYFKIKNNYNF